MNKTQLVDIIAEETGAKKDTITKVLNGMVDAIQTVVGAGDEVRITGFGAFDALHRPARTARNPQTGEPVKVAESWAPRFRPGSEFKAAVAEGGRTVKAA